MFAQSIVEDPLPALGACVGRGVGAAVGACVGRGVGACVAGVDPEAWQKAE